MRCECSWSNNSGRKELIEVLSAAYIIVMHRNTSHILNQNAVARVLPNPSSEYAVRSSHAHICMQPEPAPDLRSKSKHKWRGINKRKNPEPSHTQNLASECNNVINNEAATKRKS